MARKLLLFLVLFVSFLLRIEEQGKEGDKVAELCNQLRIR